MRSEYFVLKDSLLKQGQASAYPLTFHERLDCPSLVNRGWNASDVIYFDGRLVSVIKARRCARCTDSRDVMRFLPPRLSEQVL